MLFGKPTIIVPFSEDCPRSRCQDIFIYLRPESNGVKVESTIMSGVSRTAELRKHIDLAYLANLPGEFLSSRGVFRNHYRTRVVFAQYGVKIFTPYMKNEFEKYFNEKIENVRIVGAYKALDLLKFTKKELFDFRVPVNDMLRVNGQTIKKIKDIYVINYDIPEIISNNNKTDIAVMIFRTDYTGEEFYNVILGMTDLLVEEGIIHEKSMFSHVFHYSKGPFEQILDAVGFLYDDEGNHLPLERIRFYKYIKQRGLNHHEIKHTLEDPIFQFFLDDNNYMENSIFEQTKNLEYNTAFEVIQSARAQIYLDSYAVSK